MDNRSRSITPTKWRSIDRLGKKEGLRPTDCYGSKEKDRRISNPNVDVNCLFGKIGRDRVEWLESSILQHGG
jgi:hypothetical protein